MRELNAIETVALAQALSSKEVKAAKGAIAPTGLDEDGKVARVPVDVTVRIQGTLGKGEDFDKVPTVSAPLISAMALLVRRMGVTREAALELLCEVMTEAIELGKDANKAILEESGVLEAQGQVKKEVLTRLPKTPVQGRVESSLTASVVEATGSADLEVAI